MFVIVNYLFAIVSTIVFQSGKIGVVHLKEWVKNIVISNLHVIISYSTLDKIEGMCRMHSDLVKEVTVLHINDWNNDGRYEIAKVVLNNQLMKSVEPLEQGNEINIHNTSNTLNSKLSIESNEDVKLTINTFAR